MIKHILFSIFGLMVFDIAVISWLRSFLIDFLRAKRNKKSTRKIHTSQPMMSRITLNYIKPLLVKYTSEFASWHRLYLGVLYTLIPQYAILILCNLLFETSSLYVLGLFGFIKLVVIIIIRLNCNSNRESIYVKKR